SSAFGAVSPVYRLFVPLAWGGGAPGSSWGIPWLVLLAAGGWLLRRSSRALVVWTAAISLPPSVYWLDNHAITASISFSATALGMGFLAARRPTPAIWSGALGLATYPAAG